METLTLTIHLHPISTSSIPPPDQLFSQLYTLPLIYYTTLANIIPFRGQFGFSLAGNSETNSIALNRAEDGFDGVLDTNSGAFSIYDERDGSGLPGECTLSGAFLHNVTVNE